MKIYNVTGGIGRQIAFTALIPKLAEKEKIYILSPYPDIFQLNPYVERSIPIGMPYVWTDYIIKNENELICPEPYFNNRFIHKECHLVEAFAEECKIEYSENMKPDVILSKQLENDADKFLQENGKFIIVQLMGGQAPFGDFKNKFAPVGQKRFYPEVLAQRLIKLIKKEFDFKILNMNLPNEFKLEDTIQITSPYLFYIALLKRCETFIAIDSSLNHMSACVQKKGIVLWFGTSSIHFSYNHNINLHGECKDIGCSRPYVRELGDLQPNGQMWECPDPICQTLQPEIIMEKLCHLIQKK